MPVSQLKIGAILNYVILGLHTLVGLLYTPYMLRMLGQSEYGLYSLAASVIAYLSMLDLGFGNAVIRYTSKFRAEGKQEEQYAMFGMFTILYSIIGIVTFLVGLVLYFNVESIFGAKLTLQEIEHTRTIVMLMVINLALTFPLSIYGAIITAYENFIFLRVVQILKIVLMTAVLITVLTIGYKAVALVIVQTIFNIVTLGINYFYCRTKIKIQVNFGKTDRKLLKEIAVYSFWIFLNVIMDRIYWSTGQFVLGAISGTIAVSVYAVAIHFQGIYMSLSMGISGVFLPRITGMVAKGDSRHEISDLFIRTGRLQYCLIAFVLSGFILFGRTFIGYWAGEEYEDSYIMVVIFFTTLTIPLIQNLGITILQARNEMKFRSLLYIGIAVCSLALQIPFSKYYGSIGCATAVGMALLIGQGLIMNIYYHRKQDLNMIAFWKEIVKMSIIPVVLVIVFFVVAKAINIQSRFGFCVEILVYSIVYLAMFWKFSMNQYERDLFGRPIKKLLDIK